MRTIKLFILLLVIQVSESHAQTPEWVSVSPIGETLIKGTFAKDDVQIKIATHELDIGSPSAPVPTNPDNSCTYSRYPCSLVDRMEISVNSKKVHVARSVFSNLSDINRASVSKNKKNFLLVIEGGDASESYIKKIEFDDKRVRRTTNYGEIFPDKILMEVIFH